MRSTWARLIHKVYEIDPLECPKCKGPMRVIELVARTRLHLVLNLRTAKAQGIKLPQSLLVRADRVIE